MSPSSLMFLFMRLIHVLLAAVWVGTAVFTAYFLMPAIADAGPAGGQVMAAVSRRGLTRFLGIVAGVTILSGVYLYWRFTGGFDPGVSGSRPGIVFGIGGVAGVLAGVVGGAVVGRSALQLDEHAARLTSLADGPERARLVQHMGALRTRMADGTRILILLQVIALALMVVGHYV